MVYLKACKEVSQAHYRFKKLMDENVVYSYIVSPTGSYKRSFDPECLFGDLSGIHTVD